MDRSDRISVKIFSPYQIFYKGSAITLSAVNKTGPFDILYNHTNFFTLINPCQVVVNTGFETIRIQVESGILKVRDNNVTLFANV